MNRYKVTATRSNGTEISDHFIEATEGAARKAFKECYRSEEYTDVKAELVEERVQATKEQEREALAKIVKIVAELGPDSYLATAFDGAFEDAETNIENDFAFSMKGRVEAAERELKRMGGDYNSAKRDADVAQKALAAAEAQLAAAREEIAALKRSRFPEELRRDLWVMVTNEAEASRARMAEAAEKMAVSADNPGCVLFRDSVANYRAEKARAEVMERRAAELDTLEPRGEQ